MADKVSRFEIVFDGEAGDLLKVLGNVKGQVRSAAADIEATSARVELFKGAQDRAEELSRTIGTLSVKAAEFRQKLLDLEGAGASAPKELTDALKDTEKQLASTTRELDKQTASAARLSAQLKAGGVDVTNLAAEQTRLAQALREASAAETERQAKAVLGLRTTKEITPEVQRLYAAYNTLASSGTLSVKELAAAQAQLQTRVVQLKSQVTGLADSARAGGPDLVAMFSRSILPALGLAGGVASVVTALKAAVESAHAFEDGVARIGTVTNLTKEQLGGLGEQAAALARELGVNVDEALRGLFDLIRSGVSPDNAIEVLRASAIAAKASVAELGDGVKAANLLISAFGVDAKDVGPALDKIVQGAKDGGATLKEFAESGGPLLNVARAAGIELNDLVATLTVMVNASGNAGESISALTKIIQKLDTADAREKLRALGIEATSLVDIFSQIGERHLALDQVLELGVASTKSAAGVAALTNNAKALPPELDRIATSAGSAAKGVQALYDSPKERAARFDAELKSATNSIGALVGGGDLLTRTGTSILHEFNQIPAAFRESARVFDETGGSITKAALALLQVDPLAQEAARTQRQLAAATADTADKTDRLAISVAQSNATLRDFSARLLADTQAIQQGFQRDIADANARADAQIAALDRAAAATKATAAQTLVIQTKLAADRLAIIVKAEADIAAATDKAVAARTATARKAGQDEAKIAADNAAARIAALAPVLAQYQAHYNALVQQAQTYASKLQTLENERVEFNRGIEKTLFDIRLSGLDAFDQYLAKAKEVDRLISEAREAGAKGDVANAKKYTDEAIQLALSLRAVTDENGVKVITELQAQTQATDLVKKAAAGYNDTLAQQADAAKAGADATKAGIDQVLPKLTDLQQRYDALKAAVAEGLELRVKLDEKTVADALATINELTKDREVHIKVVEDRTGTTPGETPPPTGPTGQPLARGGYAGFARRVATSNPIALPGFAAGGKVPGAGDGDTVPMALQAGSFVVRKAASRYYGDGIMARVAHYALGGPVATKDQIRQYAETKWGYDPFGPRTDTGGTAPVIDPKQGFRSGDSFQNNTPAPISFDTRPIPDALITAANVVTYAREMLNAVGQNNPLLASFLPQMEAALTAVDRNPFDKTALTTLLQLAETLGTNPYLFAMWGKTQSAQNAPQPIWFIDWLEQHGYADASGNATGAAKGGGSGGSTNVGVTDFATKVLQPAITRLGNPLTAQPRNPRTGQPFNPLSAPPINPRTGQPYRPFALGGAPSDTVPAMLTPGEWVIQRPRAQQLGASMMHAINNIAVPREALASMLRAPRPRGYAMGGEVGGQYGTPERLSGTPQPVGGGDTFHFHLERQDDEEWVRRKLIPQLNRIDKRSR